MGAIYNVFVDGELIGSYSNKWAAQAVKTRIQGFNREKKVLIKQAPVLNWASYARRMAELSAKCENCDD